MGPEYRQCHLEQSRGRATIHHTAWLPATFAVLGGVVRLRERDGDWGDGWRVTFVGPTVLSDEAVRKAERAHLKQRQASDI